MRVLAVGQAPERYGGAQLSLLDVIRGLAARGHEIDFVHGEQVGSLLADYAAVCSSVQQAELRTPSALRHWRWDEPELADTCRRAVVERFRLQRQAEEIEAVLEGAVGRRRAERIP